MTEDREVHEITISARIVEGVDDNGEYYPEAVVVSGAEFLAASAATDIAQETINSYFGSYRHPYIALRPDDWADEALLTSEKENYRFTVEKRG